MCRLPAMAVRLRRHPIITSITSNVNNDVDTMTKNRGNDRMMSALKRFAADISIRGSSHNLTRDELMDLVYVKFDKIDAEQSRKAAREAMEIEKKKDNADSFAMKDANATKSDTGRRSAPGPTLISVSRPEPQVPRVPTSQRIGTARKDPLPGPATAPGNPDDNNVAGPSATPMARVRKHDMLNLLSDIGRPVKKAEPPAKKPEASRGTSEKP